MAKVPFLKLNFDHDLNEQINNSFKRVNASGNYILGSEVSRFEKEFAEFCGTKHCLGISNGLDALFLALKALNLTAADSVVVPANTFIATWLAPTELGCQIVPVDAESHSGQLDPILLEQALKKNPKIKCVILVHLYGAFGDIKKIKELCEKYNVFLIEDAAQAHGTSLNNIKAGGWGDLAIFSFYPGKNLGALGDAGAIVTSNTKLYDSIKILRNYGSSKKYHHDVIGYNRRMDEVQAAILCEKLPHLTSWNLNRSQQVEIYMAQLKDVGDIKFFKSYSDTTSWHLFVIRTKQRDSLHEYLKSQDIETLIHYPIACHLSKAYEYLGFKQGSFPISESIANECLSLPIGPHLSFLQIETVINALKSFFR